MTLASRLSTLNNRFTSIQAAATSLPAGQQAAITTAKNQFQAMALDVPSRLTGLYDNFSQNLQSVGATVKSIGQPLDDNPSRSICGIMAFAAAGDFLEQLETATQALLNAILSAPSTVATALAQMLSDLDDAIGFSAALQDIENYLQDAADALADYAETLGLAGLRDLAQLASCLTHAAEFTVNRATLAAKQLADAGLSGKQALDQARTISLNRTGIRATTQAFTQSMQAKLDIFGGG